MRMQLNTARFFKAIWLRDYEKAYHVDDTAVSGSGLDDQPAFKKYSAKSDAAYQDIEKGKLVPANRMNMLPFFQV